MRKRLMRKVILMLISLSLLFLGWSASHGETIQGYRIAQYDVIVDVLKDGSLDITEKVNFSFLGNTNNAVLLIDKQKDEEIEIKNVYTQVKDKMIECERLSVGQWDANVFTGTYSEIQESNLVRLKVYGVFKKQQANIIVRYSVKNGIKRYRDIAIYKRKHVQEYWKGYIKNLTIDIKLPRYIASEKIKPFLHGVLVGHKNVQDKSIIKYSIPSTVPGEYVEARVVFPENLVNEAPRVNEERYLETVLQEEKEYNESDKTNLLKARENAAKEAGKKAWSEMQKKRIQAFSMIMSLFASFLGILTIFRSNKSFKENIQKVSFGLNDIPSITPAEARLLMRGKIGARGILGGLFHLASKGFLEVKLNNNDVCFIMKENCDTSNLNDSEKHLLSLAGSLCSDEGEINSGQFKYILNNSDISKRIKEQYIVWDKSVKRGYSEKNQLNSEQLYYRNFGLIIGVILFAAGCIVPVAVSIWSGYLMLPVGFFLFTYVLSAERKTAYSIVRIRALKELKELLISNNKKIEQIPNWMYDLEQVLGYAIALGVENKLDLLRKVLKARNNLPSSNMENEDDESLESILEKVLISTDKLLSNLLAY